MSTKVMTRQNEKNRNKIRTMAQIGMLSAIATVLMLFEIPLPFAPSFYEIDFSEVPILIGSFAMGPLAGAAIELIKILLNFAINGTMTAGVGEIANFLIGCSLVVPAALIYHKKHTRIGAVAGMAAGTVFMTVVGCFLNAFVLLPAYAKAFGMPIDGLVGMGTAVNKHITDLKTFVILAVGPFNLLKGILVSLIVFLVYKKISPILKIGMLPVKRTIKNNKFLYRQPCYGWRYFMLLLYIAHDISLVSLHAVSFEVVGCCSNLCN